jgi:peroxiredoxin (alkyl hydroperoxide reductase subunit C)
VDIPFPVIADVDLKVARLYGMVGSGSSTATVRSVFFIDPNLTIRATLSYPAAIGRNIDELLRVFDAFQENTASGGCAIPANWTPGQPTLSPAPCQLTN